VGIHIHTADLPCLSRWEARGAHSVEQNLTPPAARNYSLVLRRSQSVTIFVGSTASLSICISTTLPSLSIK